MDSDATCQPSDLVAEVFCGTYFVRCPSCDKTLITIPWFSAETLLKGELTVYRVEGQERQKVAEGLGEQLIPVIRDLLMYDVRLELTGLHAVLKESDLGKVKNNPLPIQRDYFKQILSKSPRDETAPFALAQIVREMGEDHKANAHYDAGLAIVNSNWLRKLPVWALPTIIIAAIMWKLSVPIWICAIVSAIGPAIWLLIRRNRKRWLPMIGFAQRAETAATVDMAEALADAKQE